MSTAPLAAEAPAAAPQSPWVAVGMVLIGTSAATLNSNVVGIALPDVAAELQRGGALGVDWVVTGFLLGVVLALPLTGWLCDRVGRRAVWIASLACFAAGALVCTAAPAMEVLVAGRILQGFGGGTLMPVGMIVVYELFPPHRRGTALGVWGVASMAGPALGPPLGGWLLASGSWRWIFAIFVVVGVVGAMLAVRWLPDVGHREDRPLDAVGWVLTSVMVTVVVLAVRQLGTWGATSPAILGAGATSLLLLAVLVRRSLRRTDPIVEFRMFSVPTYSVAMLLGPTALVCQTAYLTFLPVELQVVRGLDPQQVGLMLVPAAIGTGLLMTVAGWLVDRVGARIPVVVGFVAFAWGLWELAHLRPDGSEADIARILLVQGMGLGLVFIPVQVAAMNSLPGRFVSQASAMSNLLRQLSGAVGVAFLSAVLVADLGAVSPVRPVVEEAQAGYNRVFLLVFWLASAAAVVALALPGRTGSRRHQDARLAEVAPPL